MWGFKSPLAHQINKIFVRARPFGAHYVQNLVFVRTWGFKSPSAHQTVLIFHFPPRHPNKQSPFNFRVNNNLVCSWLSAERPSFTVAWTVCKVRFALSPVITQGSGSPRQSRTRLVYYYGKLTADLIVGVVDESAFYVQHHLVQHRWMRSGSGGQAPRADLTRSHVEWPSV